MYENRMIRGEGRSNAEVYRELERYTRRRKSGSRQRRDLHGSVPA